MNTKVEQKVKENCERAGLDVEKALEEVEQIIESKGISDIGALQVWKSDHSRELMQVLMDVPGYLSQFDVAGRAVTGRNGVPLVAHDLNVLTKMDGHTTVLNGVVWERVGEEDAALDIFSHLHVGKCYMFKDIGIDPKVNKMFPSKGMTVEEMDDTTLADIMSGKLLSISEVGDYINESQCYTGILGGFVPAKDGTSVGLKVGDPLADIEDVEQVIWFDTDDLDTSPDEIDGMVGMEVIVLARAYLSKDDKVSMSGIHLFHQ